MKIHSIYFLLTEAFAGLWRHGLMTLAAISTSAICFTMMGTFVSVLYAMNAVSQSMMSELGVAVYMKTNTDRADTLNTRDALVKMPGVLSVTIVPREKAWPAMKKKLGDRIPFEAVNENPLTDELRVVLKDLDHVQMVSEAAGNLKGVDQAKAPADVVRDVRATVSLLKQLGIIAAGLLMLATLLVISNVIHLTMIARSEEIKIMQLVGATRWFIRIPFLLEGLFYGIGGALLAGAISHHGAMRLFEYIRSTHPFLPLTNAVMPANSLALFMVAAGAGVGLIGSTLSIRKFLNA